MRFALLTAVMLCASGCYASHELGVDAGARDAGPATCTGAPPRCIAPNDDPCGPPHDTMPECHGVTWSCPTGARVYAAVEPVADCRPFHDPSMGIRALGGSLPRIPTPDGRCL